MEWSASLHWCQKRGRHACEGLWRQDMDARGGRHVGIAAGMRRATRGTLDIIMRHEVHAAGRQVRVRAQGK